MFSWASSIKSKITSVLQKDTQSFTNNIIISMISIVSAICSLIAFTTSINLLFVIAELTILSLFIFCRLTKRDMQFCYPMRIAASFIELILSMYKIVLILNRSSLTGIWLELIATTIDVGMFTVSTYKFSKSYDEYANAKSLYMGKINWVSMLYTLAMHTVATIGLFYIDSWWLMIEILVWQIVCGFGVTVGMHRLWSHRSFRARAPLRFLLMILASMSNQGSIYHWCRDHRVHHKKSDTNGDPHNIERGFFFSHCGWLFLHKHVEVKEAGKELEKDGMLSDLLQDPIVKINHAMDPFLNQFCCFVLPGIYGLWRFEPTLSGFAFGALFFGFVRWVIESNATWCVNSVAHTFGNRPYRNIPPAESVFVSIATAGEGWHNYHHTYPFDYATSEYGFFKQYNLSKVFIDFMHMIGQAHDLKRHKHVSFADTSHSVIG